MSKLFVYGIFLGEGMRKRYGMTNPRYDTVKDYLTVGDYIAQAQRVPNCDLVLTGLVVDIPDTSWESLDRLEMGYDRILVTTTNNERAYMYVRGEI